MRFNRRIAAYVVVGGFLVAVPLLTFLLPGEPSNIVVGLTAGLILGAAAMISGSTQKHIG